MPLFETLPINEDEVRSVVQTHWSLQLGQNVKASQNHTFLATRSDESNQEKKFVVRVTPDPHGQRNDSVEVEVALLGYLHQNNLPVCPTVPTISTPVQRWIRTDSALIIVVFEFATGEPIKFADWKWLEQPHANGVGRWFAKLHKLTRQFAAQQPELYKRARVWSELHDSILSEAPIDQQDKDSVSNPSRFGLIHGDVNVSNYFWDEKLGLPCMFDWDQTQRSWFYYDLSTPIWTVVTLVEGGNPVNDDPIPAHANVGNFTNWLVEGYEQESGEVVDRAALLRMLALRRQLYKRFCKRAITELPHDLPMYRFCLFMTTWLEKSE